MTKIYAGYDYKGKHLLSGVYAHGTLNDKSGYDFCFVDDGFDRSVERIEEVIAVTPDGEEIPAIMFFWHRHDFGQGGLVVEVDDAHYMKDAQKKFDERAEDI